MDGLRKREKLNCAQLFQSTQAVQNFCVILFTQVKAFKIVCITCVKFTRQWKPAKASVYSKPLSLLDDQRCEKSIWAQILRQWDENLWAFPGLEINKITRLYLEEFSGKKNMQLNAQLLFKKPFSFRLNIADRSDTCPIQSGDIVNKCSSKNI